MIAVGPLHEDPEAPHALHLIGNRPDRFLSS